jgi:hypothetical protein
MVAKPPAPGHGPPWHGGGALNAVQHGLLSRQAVIQGESEAELIELGKRLRGQLLPTGELELLLVDRIVSTAWRLRRAVSLETICFGRCTSCSGCRPSVRASRFHRWSRLT